MLADLFTLSLTHLCSCVPSDSCSCGLLLYFLTNSSTLFLRVSINSLASFSLIYSFPWLGFRCISLLALSLSIPGFSLLIFSLSLSLPGFGLLNGSPLSKLLIPICFLKLLIHHSYPLLATNLISSKVIYVVDHSWQLVGLLG